MPIYEDAEHDRLLKEHFATTKALFDAMQLKLRANLNTIKVGVAVEEIFNGEEL